MQYGEMRRVGYRDVDVDIVVMSIREWVDDSESGKK